MQEQVKDGHQNSSTFSGSPAAAGGSVRSHWTRGQPVFIS